MEQKITATIIDLHRTTNSGNGNPRYRVTLDNGRTYRTETDAAVNNMIDNSEYRDVPVRLTLRDARIIGVEVASNDD
jgi:hypothetical protein